MRRALLPFAVFVVAAGIAQARVMIPREAQEAKQYFEMVREKKPCPANDSCFVEYLVLSNGLIVQKKVDSEKYDEVAPAFTIRRAVPSAADSAFADVAAYFQQGNAGGGSFTDANNLYYFDGSRYQLYSGPEPVPAAFTGVFDSLGKAFADAGETEAFYLHAYYQPVTGATLSFHFFADGTFITSGFDRNSYKMTSTTMRRLAPEARDALRAAVVKAHDAKPGKFMHCAANTGYEYGLVEFTDAGHTLKSYTCGTGDGAIPAILNAIKAQAQ